MEDLGHWHFKCRGCRRGEACDRAHRLADLTNPDRWVVFLDQLISMRQYLPHPGQCPTPPGVDRLHVVPGVGTVVRCVFAEDAAQLLLSYGPLGRPLRLSDALTQLSIPRESTPPPAVVSAQVAEALPYPTAAVESASSSSSSSSSPSFSPILSSPIVPSQSAGHTLRHSGLAVSSARQRPVENPMKPNTATLRPTGPPPQTRPLSDLQFEHARIRQRAAEKSEQVLQFVRDHPDLTQHSLAGWEALRHVCGFHRSDLDGAVLWALGAKKPFEQEQIMLTFAALGLAAIKNPSGYLISIMTEHDSTRPVCMRFLCGLCGHPACRYLHPVDTPGWQDLKERWGLTYKDFDYAVLNYLAKKSQEEQDTILADFARMDLTVVYNHSAYLSSLIHKLVRKAKATSVVET